MEHRTWSALQSDQLHSSCVSGAGKGLIQQGQAAGTAAVTGWVPSPHHGCAQATPWPSHFWGLPLSLLDHFALRSRALCVLQTFDTMTRTPFLATIAYHERAHAVAYAQHFGVPLTGGG
jgi:hypothetical protein